MRILTQLTLGALVACMPLVANAEQERGNGGDGVFMDDGTIVLFDLFERSLMLVERATNEKVRNFTMDSVARGLIRRKLPNYETIDKTWRVDVERSLGHRLSFFATDYPSIVKTVVDELDELTWAVAPVDLKPNVDTHPFLDLTGVKRLGCARTIDKQTLFSPSCAGPKMRAAHFAALLIHEALYSYIKKLRPEMKDSFPVRTAVAVLYGLKIGHPYTYTKERRKALRESGYGALIDRDEKIQEVFFKGNLGYSWDAVDCEFPADSRVQRVALRFSGALYINGEVNVPEGKAPTCNDLVYGYSRESKAAYRDCNYASLNEVEAGYLVGVPEFNLEDKSVTITVGVHDGEERFVVQRWLDGPRQVKYSHWNNDEWEHREGTCKR